MLNILGGCCLAAWLNPHLYILYRRASRAVVYYLFRDIFLDSILDVFFLPSIFSSRQASKSSFESAFSNERAIALCLCVCVYEENEKASQGKDARDN